MTEKTNPEKKSLISNGAGKNLIVVAIIIAGVLIAGAVIYINWGKAEVLSPQQAAEKAINYINENLLQEGVSVSLINVTEENGVYKFRLKLGENEFDSYVTKNGKLLFIEGINIEEKPPETPPKEQGEQTQYEKTSVLDGQPLLGNPNAPVTLIEFTDFQCSFCGRYANTTFFEIKKKYVDTGKVKTVFKNFPLSFHENAQKAAEASECAFEQGKFWGYKEVLFNNQNNLSIADLKKYAQDVSLEIPKFNSCLDLGKFENEVKKDFKEGQDLGVSGTPTFFINGEKIIGAQPFSEFQKIIENKLK